MITCYCSDYVDSYADHESCGDFYDDAPAYASIF